MLQDERLIELISGSLDDELSAEEKVELEAALASSAEARQLAAEMREDREALRNLRVLSAPDSLKQRAVGKMGTVTPLAPGRPWQRVALLAASLALTFGIFRTFGPTGDTLYLSQGRLTTRAEAHGQELQLASKGGSDSHTMVSENLSGRFLPGKPTRVDLLGDAGTVPGGKLLVSLQFDFDGDGQIDLDSHTHVLEVDSTHGYENLVCTFPAMEGMRDLTNGTVQLEVACEDSPPVKLNLEQASLTLPFADLKSEASYLSKEVDERARRARNSQRLSALVGIEYLMVGVSEQF